MAELEEAGSKLRMLLIPMIAGIPAAAYLSGIGAVGAGGLLGLTSRTVQRAKDSGPVAQAAMVVGAVAAAGLLAVGSLAVARAVTGGSGEETAITTPGGAGGGSGGGGGGTGDGSSGSDASGGGGSDRWARDAPAGSDAPAVTDAPPTAEPSVVSPGGDSTIPEDEAPDLTPPVEPETTTGPTPPPTTGATVPTVPTIADHAAHHRTTSTGVLRRLRHRWTGLRGPRRHDPGHRGQRRVRRRGVARSGAGRTTRARARSCSDRPPARPS